MSETASEHEVQENIFVTNYEGHLGTNVTLRWQMYEHAEEQDIQARLLDELVRPGDRVVDVGCGRGHALIRLAAQSQHESSQFVGIDRDSSGLSLTKRQARGLGTLPVQLVCAKAENLPLADNSADVSLSLFVLYHVSDIDTSLQEMHRITREDGTIVIGTSSPRNKAMMRVFEDRIAEYLGVDGPPRLTRTFTSENASQIIEQHLDLIGEPQLWQSEFRLTSVDPEDRLLGIYLDSLATMKQYYDPYISWDQMKQAFFEVCAPTIEEEIASRGYFAEPLERIYYVCRPRK